MGRARERGSGKRDVPLLERDGMISKEELAEFLDVPESTLDHWASRGGGPEFHGIGNHRKYWPADVKAWLATRRRRTSSESAQGAA